MTSVKKMRVGWVVAAAVTERVAFVVSASIYTTLWLWLCQTLTNLDSTVLTYYWHWQMTNCGWSQKIWLALHLCLSRSFFLGWVNCFCLTGFFENDMFFILYRVSDLTSVKNLESRHNLIYPVQGLNSLWKSFLNILMAEWCSFWGWRGTGPA